MIGPVLSIVTVCSGNICRSPMAEKVLRSALADAGLAGEVRVSSVGIGSWHAGEDMDPRAAATLQSHGYEVGHVARQVGGDIAEADLVLAATNDHVRDLRRAGASADTVRLLRSFDPAAPQGAEVPDPYYGGDDGFDEVLAMIEAAAPGIVAGVGEQ